MKNHGLSRRGFLKASVLAGVAVYVAPLGSRAFAALFEEKLLTPSNGIASPASPIPHRRHREGHRLESVRP